jgi:site-specific recombinase XerD/ribosomal protein L40E
VDWHNYSGRLERALVKIRESDIPEQNKRAIEDFKTYLSIKGLSLARIESYIQRIREISLMTEQNFCDMTNDDAAKILDRIISNADWGERYKYDFKITMRCFFKWLKEYRGGKVEIAFIRASHNSNQILPEEILTEEEVRSIAQAADNLRDRALVLVLYESGCRIGEILGLKIKHVQPNEHGMALTVNGKTGSRRVLIISSAPALANWLNIHPFRDNPESHVWIGLSNCNKNSVLNYGAILPLLKELSNRAGVKKRVYPHLFRHSRATHLANFLTEAQMKQYFGWVQGSDMAAVYVHLSGRDVDNSLLKLNGITVEDEKLEQQLKARTCQRCEEKNSPVSKFCSRCGSPLDITTAMQLDEKRKTGDEVISMLVKDPMVQGIIVSKILSDAEFREKMKHIL